MEAMSKLATEIEKRHPCTEVFDPEALAAWHIRRGGKNSTTINGKPCTWIGNKGSLWEAPLGMKQSFVKCSKIHGEDAAKIWAWLQGWMVGKDTSYSYRFSEEIKDAAADIDLRGDTDTSGDVAGDRTDEQSGSNVVTDEDELPF